MYQATENMLLEALGILNMESTKYVLKDFYFLNEARTNSLFYVAIVMTLHRIEGNAHKMSIT